MKNKLNLVSALILIFCSNCFAQTNYYKINGGNLIDEKSYNDSKNKLSKYGKIEEFHLKTVKNNDSIINYIKLGNLITTPDGFDPWGNAKKNIGSKFQIEKYVDKNYEKYKSDYLNGKPTFINFWFTRCPPCINELPILNKLKEKYGDSVNFISITFDNQKLVDAFLKKYEFKFIHITNSKKQIYDLNISGYPISFILDKDGIIKIITPEIDEYEIKNVETSINILL